MKQFRKYIGLEFEEGQMDCWILTRRIMAEEFGISNLPSLRSKYSDSRDSIIPELVDREATRAWRRVDNPEAGDVVVFNITGLPAHVGVMIDRIRFLHVVKKSNACIESLKSPKWKPRIESFYRHETRR